jgi:putative transcriptional regulator
LVKFTIGSGKMVKVEIEGGYYLFKLNDILKEKQISKNQLMRETNSDFKVIKRIITGELTKLDIIVLARICNYLNCNISDIIEYYPSLIKEKEEVK